MDTQSTETPPPRTEPLPDVQFAQRQLPAHLEWDEADRTGKPLTVSKKNMLMLLRELRLVLQYNRFTCSPEVRIRGELVPINDHHLNVLWERAHSGGLRIKLNDLQRMVQVIALDHSYHPVLNYLDSIKWDGTSRLDTWLTVYLGAADTQINQAFGRSALLGACHRVIEPGCKHDTMLGNL